MITLKYEYEDTKLEYSFSDELTTGELIENFGNFLIVLGHHPDNVREVIGECKICMGDDTDCYA